MVGEQFDYSLLRNEIRSKFKTEADFAKAIGMGRVALSQKLNNRYDFTSSQIINAMETLDIPMSEMSRYFFTTAVHEVEPQQSTT